MTYLRPQREAYPNRHDHAVTRRQRRRWKDEARLVYAVPALRPDSSMTFTPEFKAEIVELCRRGDRSIGRVAKDFDLTETNVRNWLKRAEIDRDEHPGLTTEEKKEVTRLRRENWEVARCESSSSVRQAARGRSPGGTPRARSTPLGPTGPWAGVGGCRVGAANRCRCANTRRTRFGSLAKKTVARFRSPRPLLRERFGCRRTTSPQQAFSQVQTCRLVPTDDVVPALR